LIPARQIARRDFYLGALMRIFAGLMFFGITISGAAAGEKLTGPQIEAILNDSTAWYLPLEAMSARQYFNKNGETPYVDAAGEKTYGTWTIKGDKYCSIWPPSERQVCFEMEKGVLADGTVTFTFVSGGGGKRYEAVFKSGKHIDEPWGG
jgi:hypothetical protein